MRGRPTDMGPALGYGALSLFRNPMLRAATPVDLDFIRRVLVEGAADGSFDPELAASTPASALFFANLGNALGCGFLRASDAEGKPTCGVQVAGYMYSTHEGSPAIGFGLFKELDGGSFELWLTGIAGDARGHGHGHAMLGELLATPAGRMTHVVRCNRRSANLDIAVRLFRNFGFALWRDTPGVVWLVNAKAPPELMTRIAHSPNLAL